MLLLLVERVSLMVMFSIHVRQHVVLLEVIRVILHGRVTITMIPLFFGVEVHNLAQLNLLNPLLLLFEGILTTQLFNLLHSLLCVLLHLVLLDRRNCRNFPAQVFSDRAARSLQVRCPHLLRVLIDVVLVTRLNADTVELFALQSLDSLSGPLLIFNLSHLLFLHELALGEFSILRADLFLFEFLQIVLHDLVPTFFS